MALRTCFSNICFRLSVFCLLTAALLALTACTVKRPVMVMETETALPLPAPEMVTPSGKVSGQSTRTADARTAAAHSLIRDGYQMLQNNDYDGAIRVLERAVGINAKDGQGYFYLAEAWLKKGDLDLAARFNELATLYLRGNSRWARQARVQKQRIANTLMDVPSHEQGNRSVNPR